jgi:hypothetical protein
MDIAQAMGCHPGHGDEVKTGLQNFLGKQMLEIAESITQHAFSSVRAT